jgi:type VI secretion system secreted protein VgrG
VFNSGNFFCPSGEVGKAGRISEMACVSFAIDPSTHDSNEFLLKCKRRLVMPKKKLLGFGFLILTLGFSNSAPAATNPDLAALSQGSVVQFTGTERISQPFAFDFDLTVPHAALNFANVVGQPLKLTVAPGRAIGGMVDRIEQVGVSGRQGQYRVRIVPALNRLSFRITSRTFADMNPVQIVNGLLNEAGVSGIETRIGNALSTQEITVQYQENELTFLSRLLEEEGIHYHFELSASGEKMVLGDSNNAFPVLPPGKLVFGAQTTPSITSFSRGQSIHSGHVQSGDFNWKTPQANLTAAVQTPLFADLVEGVFPAPVDTPQGSQRYAGMRLGTRISEGQVCRGESTYPQLQAGYRFLLAGHPRNDFNQEYVITEVDHQGTPKGYHNTFTCIPASVIFRPSPVTPRPKINGVLPGIVVGPKGETKDVDNFGRVRVRFPWRNPAFSNNDGSGDSGWVRVAQIAAGGGTTSMWLPEVGDEVLVAFEHGDPHRPVILGSLWNGKDMPPSSLPANKFRSIFQSRSASGGINEIVFDDTSGQERLILRSGNQFLSLSAASISASSAINTQPPGIQSIRPSTGLKTPSLPVVPKR